MKLNITKGPWHVGERSKDDTALQLPVSDSYGCVAWVVNRKRPDMFGSDTDNARLIAASPDLFAAVSRVLMEMEKWDGEISIGAVEDMEAAMAKIKGEP